MTNPNKESEILSEGARWLLRELDTQDGPSLNSGGGGGRPFEADPSIKKAWSYLRDEVHDLICTNSAKYRKERGSFNAVEKPIVLLFGSLITSHFSLEAATATTLATLALSMPLNIGRNAWCQAYKARKSKASDNRHDDNSYMDGERENLLMIANFKADLASKDVKKRVRAIDKLATNKLIDEDIVALLIGFMSDPDADLRGSAAYALAHAGTLAEPAIPTFIQGLKDRDQWVRTHCIGALSQFKDHAPKFLDDLTACLKDRNARVRDDTAGALGRLGKAAAASLPVLKEAFDKEDAEGKSYEYIYAKSALAGTLLQAIRKIEKSMAE
jgi:hypothetical protein